MALRASALKGAAVVAAICVALAVCWVGKPAEGAPTCGIHRCISECPSKCNNTALSSCEGAKSTYAQNKCKPSCFDGCNYSCHNSGATTCDDTCNSNCDRYCNDNADTNPSYLECVFAKSQACKDSCEKACKGEKVNN